MARTLEEVRALLAQQGIAVPEPTPAPPPKSAQPDYAAYQEYVPTVLTNEQQTFSTQINQVIESHSVIEFYNTFCGKMRPNPGSKREGIKISCPIPGHADRNPSAWANIDNNTWYCGGCGTGGDRLDLAAYNLGYPVPGYKDGKTFGNLLKEIVARFGYTVPPRAPGQNFDVLVPPGGDVTPASRTGPHLTPASESSPPGGVTGSGIGGPAAAATPPTVAPPPAPPLQPSIAQPTDTPADDQAQPLASVTVLAPKTGLDLVDPAYATADGISTDQDADFVYPTLDWRKIVTPDTFIHTYCTLTAEDDIPEEYNFWYALTAVGLALGRHTMLQDRKMVPGNLYVCSVGPSGVGKSQATGHILRLLRASLPFDWSDPSTRGALYIQTPGSGEKLIDHFMRTLAPDPNKPKETFNFPVVGYTEFAEMAELVGRTARLGSILKDILISFYDSPEVVSTSSKTGGTQEAVEPYLSVITTTQLRSLRRLLKDADNASGFLNRWVFVMGPEKKGELFSTKSIDLRPAAKPLQNIMAWSSQYDKVLVSADGKQVGRDWWINVGSPYKDKTDDLTKRIDLLFKKLILLFAANNHEHIASKETVQQAIDVMPYVMQTLDAVKLRIGMTQEREDTDALVGTIEQFTAKNNQGPTARDLARIMRKLNTSDIRKMLETLVTLGVLEIETAIPGRVGRPTTRYRKV